MRFGQLLWKTVPRDDIWDSASVVSMRECVASTLFKRSTPTLLSDSRISSDFHVRLLRPYSLMQYIWQCPRGQPDTLSQSQERSPNSKWRKSLRYLPQAVLDFFQNSSCSRSISTPFLTTTIHSRKLFPLKNVYALQSSQRHQCTPCQG